MRWVSRDWPYLLPDAPRPLPVVYVLWALWGFWGLHKLFLGRPAMALFYLLTWGGLGIGWLSDVLTLPRQVEHYRVRRFLDHRDALQRLAARGPSGERPLRRPEAIMMALLDHARRHDGSVSVTEGVMATGAPFRRVESVLREMTLSGYVDVRNDPHSGVVRYVFPELRRHER